MTTPRGGLLRRLRVSGGALAVDAEAILPAIVGFDFFEVWVGRVAHLCAAPAAVKRHTARLARRLARPVCTDTSLVSNLGVLPDPPSFSGTGQEPLWFSGPSPMPRGLGVGAVTIAGRLHLCVHYRPALLDAGAAADFTADFCRTLVGLAALPQGRPP